MTLQELIHAGAIFYLSHSGGKDSQAMYARVSRLVSPLPPLQGRPDRLRMAAGARTYRSRGFPDDTGLQAASILDLYRSVRSNRRISCMYCIMACGDDLVNGANHHPELLAEISSLEIDTGWTCFASEPLADRIARPPP